MVSYTVNQCKVISTPSKRPWWKYLMECQALAVNGQMHTELIIETKNILNQEEIYVQYLWFVQLAASLMQSMHYFL